MTMFPNGGKSAPAISSAFGPRDPRVGISGHHAGADLVGFEDVLAVEAGTVTFAGWMNGAAGYTVVIRHSPTVQSYYMHLERCSVAKGAQIPEGRKIGEVGRSGNATGDCLHYEIRVNGTAVEPIGWTAGRIAAQAAPAPAPAPAGGGDGSTPAGDPGGYNPFGIAWSKGLQKIARLYGYRGAIDGQFGPGSKAGFAQFLRANWGYAGDDQLGPVMWAAIARWLRARWGYVGDDTPGPVMRAALLRAEAQNYVEL